MKTLPFSAFMKSSSGIFNLLLERYRNKSILVSSTDYGRVRSCSA